MTLNKMDIDRVWTDSDLQARAWDLYNQLNAQRAGMSNYASVRDFVSRRQYGQPETESIAKRVWEIATRMRGDMNPSF
jgi:hypothetical protein